MKSKFRVPGRDERVMQFTGWRINSEFRSSLLDGCSFHNVSLAKAAKRAEVDFERLNRFMKGEDGLLEYIEMQRLIKAVSPHISFITISVGLENLACNEPEPDEMSEAMRAEYQRNLEWSWQQYSKRGLER